MGRQLEDGHGLHQRLGLVVQAAGGCSHFFDQSRVLLRGLIHLGDSLPDLGHTGALFMTGRADLSHDVGDPANGRDYIGHGLASLVHKS